MRLLKHFSSATNILLAVLSLVSGLVIVELVYRQIEPPEQRYMGGSEAVGAYDSRLGWVNLPNARRLFNMRGEAQKIIVEHNSQGMRYPEVGPKSRYRIAVLGDSFTWGTGLNVEDRYTDMMEKELGIDVLNFGVSGYGLAQYYLLLDKVLSFDPDLVLVGFCLSNDFNESISNFGHSHYRPYAAVENGELVIRGIPVPDPRSLVVKQKSWLMRLALGRLIISRNPGWWEEWQNIPDMRSALRYPPQRSVKGIHYSLYSYSENDPRIQQMTNIGALLFAGMKRELDRRGIPLVVYAVSTQNEYRTEVKAWDTQLGFRLLQDVLEKNDIPLILPSTPFTPSHFKGDGHWNAAGSRKAADDIVPVIRKYREGVKQ